MRAPRRHESGGPLGASEPGRTKRGAGSPADKRAGPLDDLFASWGAEIAPGWPAGRPAQAKRDANLAEATRER